MNKAIMLQNLHTHTQFCDGENTAEQMVEQAIKFGFKSIGFSSHGRVGDFSKYSLKEETVVPYREEIKRLKRDALAADALRNGGFYLKRKSFFKGIWEVIKSIYYRPGYIFDKLKHNFFKKK